MGINSTFYTRTHVCATTHTDISLGRDDGMSVSWCLDIDAVRLSSIGFLRPISLKALMEIHTSPVNMRLDSPDVL